MKYTNKELTNVLREKKLMKMECYHLYNNVLQSRVIMLQQRKQKRQTQNKDGRNHKLHNNEIVLDTRKDERCL